MIKIVLIAATAIVSGLGVFGISQHLIGIGEERERVKCEQRIAVAKAEFKAFEDEVNKLVDQYAAKASAELELGEKQSAEKLGIVLAKLAQSPAPKCTVSAAAADADRSLRRNTKGKAAAAKK